MNTDPRWRAAIEAALSTAPQPTAALADKVAALIAPALLNRTQRPAKLSGNRTLAESRGT